MFHALLLATLLAPTPTQDAVQDFASYWYSGKAEISRYELTQSRYGAEHPGHAVLVFVTEDFLPQVQVKADSSDRSQTGAWPILKLNFTKKFATGLYPYSIMTSVFTPIDVRKHPRTLKTTTSVQEWCGHTFLQLNWRDPHYQVRGFSYFQSEGDSDSKLDGAWLEDEIWTRIRIAPETLPTGKLLMIRGSEHIRLRHTPIAAVSVAATKTKRDNGTYSYRLVEEGKRTLDIVFAGEFPHRIEGWTEEIPHRGVTKAVRTHTIQSPYWNHNRPADRPLRARLGL
ncbi:MAG: hypothetical protein AAF581_06205 [Planctomycetota bacterium]